ncbi:MAG: LPS export ABC transporter periplasmic protein LptC [Candidatus Cloacimonetes bacterium]|nr:LPS export ABC transporter periplasmic protein LptC [Candidatus Cloacimonadota bacterium]
MRFWRVWLLASLVVVCILPGCSTQEPDEAIHTSLTQKSPDEISENVQITQWNLNTVDFELWAAKVLRWEKTHLTLADSVYIKSYNPDGSLKSTLVADSARMDEKNNLIIGKGHVRVDSDNGVMKADYARWDRNTDEMKAKGNIVLIRGENTLYGNELQTDIRLDRIEIVDVSAKGTVNEEDFTW